MNTATKTAKALRRDQTESEKRIWHNIRNGRLGCKFRRQSPLGPYIADFCCLDLKLVIEIDGGQHAENEKDIERTKYLNGLGFSVIRLWNHDVLENTEGAVETIAAKIGDLRSR